MVGEVAPVAPRVAPCSLRSSTLRAACGGGLRPCLSATARGACVVARRDEETAVMGPNQETSMAVRCGAASAVTAGSGREQTRKTVTHVLGPKCYPCARLNPDPAIVRPQACHIGEVQVPFRNTCFRPVADRNCVIARWCGEQREANGLSVVTRTQFGRANWRASDGKAKPRPCDEREACDADRTGDKAIGGGGGVFGDGEPGR